MKPQSKSLPSACIALMVALPMVASGQQTTVYPGRSHDARTPGGDGPGYPASLGTDERERAMYGYAAAQGQGAQGGAAVSGSTKAATPGAAGGLSPAESFLLFQKMIVSPVSAVGNASVGRDSAGRVTRLGDAPVEYDSGGRVTSFASAPISYDTSGRIVRFGGEIVHHDSTGRPVMVGQERLGYDSGGRLRFIGKDRVDYDQSGRIVRIGSKPLNYDAQGRLKTYGGARIDYGR